MCLLLDGLQHVAGFGNMGKVELGLDLIDTRPCGGSHLPCCRPFPVRAEVLPHLLRFVRLDGTGMGLFFGDTEGRQEVEDFLALNFQLSGQIVDSNLGLHPPLYFSEFPLSLHSQPHGISVDSDFDVGTAHRSHWQ